jgi:TetR/AcrR family transcriptional repressor of nem operon
MRRQLHSPVNPSRARAKPSKPTKSRKKLSRAEQKAESRARIIAAAAKLFRRNGIAATGIDQVTQCAGLTSGGFYAHFSSKSHLVREALRHAALSTSWIRTQENLRDILNLYLSEHHRDRPESGCVLAALASELDHVHASKTLRSSLRPHLEEWLQLLESRGLGREDALRALANAVGSLILARVTRGHEVSDEFLRAGRGWRPQKHAAKPPQTPRSTYRPVRLGTPARTQKRTQ